MKCRGCDADLAFWVSHKGNKIPVEMPPLDLKLPDGRNGRVVVLHFSTCPKAKDFTKQKEAR